MMFIAHNIFMSKELRSHLDKQGLVEVTGASLPVLLTDEPAEEVFCRYCVTCGERASIKSLTDGYVVTLDKNQCKRFLDVDTISFTQASNQVIHQVALGTLDHLEGSLYLIKRD